jgi:hypothetical protein
MIKSRGRRWAEHVAPIGEKECIQVVGEMSEERD